MKIAHPGRLIAVIATVAVVAGATGWAAATVLRPAEDPTTAVPYTTAVAASGVVASSLALNTVAAWSRTTVGRNRAAGVVTSVVVEDGDLVRQGDVLYTVDLRPVVVARGGVPAFRQIGAGSRGRDVSQLQQMLADLGHLRSPPDGVASSTTTAAIRAWQRSRGVEATGVVADGDVVFVPRLPVRISLDRTAVRRGETLSGGEAAVQALRVAPSFSIPATPAQAARMPAGTEVRITAPDGVVWTATAGEQSTDAQSEVVTVQLEGAGEEPACGDACDTIPVTGRALLASEVVTVPETRGLVIPSAALVSSADGSLSVRDAAGRSHPVDVSASANGMSVVTGLREGQRVRLPAVGDGG